MICGANTITKNKVTNKQTNNNNKKNNNLQLIRLPKTNYCTVNMQPFGNLDLSNNEILLKLI